MLLYLSFLIFLILAALIYSLRSLVTYLKPPYPDRKAFIIYLRSLLTCLKPPYPNMKAFFLYFRSLGICLNPSYLNRKAFIIDIYLKTLKFHITLAVICLIGISLAAFAFEPLASFFFEYDYFARWCIKFFLTMIWLWLSLLFIVTFYDDFN